MATTEKREMIRQEVSQMHEAGLKADEIAHELELSVQTVRHYMRELAIESEPEGWANAQKFLGDIIEAYKLGVAVAEIARKFETSIYCVTRVLIQEGVFAEGQLMRKQEKENREQLVVDAYQQGMRVLDIASQLQISQAHIYVVLARHGIMPARRARIQRPWEEGNHAIEG